MSAGPGHVMRAVIGAVAENPSRALSVVDFCEYAFPDARRIQKKHRVSVIRAMRKVVAAREDLRIGFVIFCGQTGLSVPAIFPADDPESLTQLQQALHPRRYSRNLSP